MCKVGKVEKLSKFQKELAKVLRDHINNKKGKIITYGEVSIKIYGHPLGSRAFRIPAGYISTFCMQNELPPLTAIMCNKETKLPGAGFDEMYNDNLPWNGQNTEISSENKKDIIFNLQQQIAEIENWSILDREIY